MPNPSPFQGPSLKEAVAYFKKKTPWCAAILSEPGLRAAMPMSRSGDVEAIRERDMAAASLDRLFRTALNTPDAVPGGLAFYWDPEAAAAGQEPSAALQAIMGLADEKKKKEEQKKQGLAADPSTTRILIPAVTFLFDLGPEIHGFNGTAHGGFLSALVDEAMGGLLFYNYAYQRLMEKKVHKETGGSSTWSPPPDVFNFNGKTRLFTASMHMHYRKPVEAPCTVAVTALFNRIDGRKWYIDVTIRDGEGTEYASCEGMWMSIRETKI